MLLLAGGGLFAILYQLMRNGQEANVADLEGKKVLWFISRVDVSDKDIKIVTPPDNEAIQNQYRIVWIPIVEDEWTDELKRRFDERAASLPLYVVRYFDSPVAGIRYIKAEWQYKGNPTVVVTSPQGVVEYRDDALPKDDQISIWHYIIYRYYLDWFHPFVEYIVHIDQNIPTWIKEHKFIFFFGGKDDEWIQHFKEKAETFVIKAGVDIKLAGSSDLTEQFWSSVESLLLTVLKNVNNNNEEANQRVRRQVQTLLWFKNESGWAMLFKGLTVVTSSHGSTMMKVLKDFHDQLTDQITEEVFETAFKEYHKTAVDDSDRCLYFDVKNGTEQYILYDDVLCPVCSHVMGTYVRFQCCHQDDAH